MYIKEFVEFHGVNPIGVLHVGAHKAEEANEYVAQGFTSKNPIIWVEAQEDLVADLKERLNPTQHKIYKAVAWHKTGEELEFHITSKSASSSLFDLNEHQEMYPDITVENTIKVTTSRLDEVLEPLVEIDFVVLDIQGAELQAITGLGNLLSRVKWIYTEVSKRELYKGATQFKDLEMNLRGHGFKRVFTAWDRKAGWGDALYVRQEYYAPTLRQHLLITSSKVRRFLRSVIPQALFPFLVWLKSHFRGGVRVLK